MVAMIHVHSCSLSLRPAIIWSSEISEKMRWLTWEARTPWIVWGSSTIWRPRTRFPPLSGTGDNSPVPKSRKHAPSQHLHHQPPGYRAQSLHQIVLINWKRTAFIHVCARTSFSNCRYEMLKKSTFTELKETINSDRRLETLPKYLTSALKQYSPASRGLPTEQFNSNPNQTCMTCIQWGETFRRGLILK